MAYNLEIVRKLLNDAFNSGEIKTLALSYSYDVYTNFSSGMRKGQMIEDLIDDAHRNGRVADLINYTKENNSYQYNLYASRLQAEDRQPISQPVPIRQAAYGNERRLQDLKRNIDREADMLNQYEVQRTYEKDPRSLAGIDHNITRQKETIAGYSEEFTQIQATLPTNVAPEIQKQLHDIKQQLSTLIGGQTSLVDGQKNLAEGQERIRDDIREQRVAILAHIDGAHRETIAVLVDKMDADQLELTELLYDAADQQEIAKWQAEQLTMLTQQSLHDIKELRKNQPDAAEWDNLLGALTSETTWEQKLKLTIPLIPGILELENEIAVDVIPALKQAWGTLVKKFRQNRDGE